MLDLAEAELHAIKTALGAVDLQVAAREVKHVGCHVNPDHKPRGPTLRPAMKQSKAYPLPRSATVSP